MDHNIKTILMTLRETPRLLRELITEIDPSLYKEELKVSGLFMNTSIR